jgi:hypothetical protein
MGVRKVTIRQSVAESVADIAWFIASKGLIETADKFSDLVYDFMERLGDSEKTYRTCREPNRSLFGYKCISYRKKYTVVFIESADELLICEFIPSKLIHW